MIKISVITWNGGFREKYHTVDSFTDQTLGPYEYEFIWSEYANNVTPALQEKIESKVNAKIVYANGVGQYHVGHCMNAGIDASSGELLILIDGDIVAERNFLECMWMAHQQMDDLAIYVRRWDESEKDHKPQICAGDLSKVCRLDNPVNYGGCLTIKRETLNRVNGYEVHPVFGGPGAVCMELYIRLRNLGVPVVWHPTERIYHPWHPGTLPSTDTLQQRMQKWIIDKRARNLDVKASARQIDIYLESFEDNKSVAPHRKLARILKKISGFRI